MIVRPCTEPYDWRMPTLSASEARAALPALLDRVTAGEEVTITRHGQPVAVMVRPDVLRSRRSDHAFTSAAEVRSLLAAGAGAPLPRLTGLSAQRADELIADVRSGRERP
jgi:antitoxin (DNA-binding transcriptional repressor) of toxin-antitoxin stability system